MAVALPLIGTALSVGAGLWMNGQTTKAANAAAEAEYTARKQLLERKQTDERNALKDNTTRRFDARDRRLAELRVAQAASGFAETGTQLAVFGEFKNRLDDDIDQGTNQALDRLASYREQVKLDRWSTDNRINQNNFDSKMNMWSTIIGGVTKGASQSYSAYRETGKSPFDIFS